MQGVFSKPCLLPFLVGPYFYLSEVNLYHVYQYIFPLNSEEGLWHLILLVPDHCLSLYFDVAANIIRRYTPR